MGVINHDSQSTSRVHQANKPGFIQKRSNFDARSQGSPEMGIDVKSRNLDRCVVATTNSFFLEQRIEQWLIRLHGRNTLRTLRTNNGLRSSRLCRLKLAQMLTLFDDVFRWSLQSSQSTGLAVSGVGCLMFWFLRLPLIATSRIGVMMGLQFLKSSTLGTRTISTKGGNPRKYSQC